MPTFSVRVTEDVASAFDRAADIHGGRSARLRQLIDRDVASKPARALSARRGPRTAARVMVRLAAPEALASSDAAASMRLSRSAWIAALVRARTLGQPTLSLPDEVQLIAIRSEIRRIGVNVNQIARALNTAVMEGRVLDLQLTEIRDFRRELTAHFAAVGEAFAGNLSYWAAGS